MLSRLAAKTLSPAPSTPNQSAAARETVDKTFMITKLQQENQQLRRELNDAYHRIRELESNLALMLVSSSTEDDDDGGDDNLSVEVQSVMSIMSLTNNSSASTIPTGSPLANEIRERQQTRDDQETLKNHRKANRTSSRLVDRHWRRHNQKQVAPMMISNRNHHRDPDGVLMQTPSSRYTADHLAGATTLQTVSSGSGASDPRLDHLSSVSEDSSSGHPVGRSSMVGRLLVMPQQTSDDVSTFTSGYFMRVDSSDDMDSLVEI